MKLFLLALATVLFMTTLPFATNRPADDRPFWSDGMSTDDFVKVEETRLKNAQAAIDKMLSVTGKRTIQNTLVPFDEAYIHLDSAGQQSGLMQEVHPDEKFRAAAEKMSQKVSAMLTDISLNRAIYDALVAMDTAGADAETKFYIDKTLRQFRLAGVDKDENTRKKIKTLNDELVLIGQEFARNIRDDKD